MAQTHEQVVDAQFGPQADAYVASAVHAAGIDLERIGALCAELKPDRALDLGCGGGHVSYALAAHARRVTACDLSADMLAAVAAEALRRGLSNIHVEKSAAERLPFGDGEFDLTVSRFSAHHWHDWEAGLREARRVTAQSGTLVFVDIVAPPSPVLDTHLQAIELLRDPSHVRDYRLSEWVAALERAGMTVTSVATHRLPLEFGSWIERMATPDHAVRAIRALQEGASRTVREGLAIGEDGSFETDVGLLVAKPAAA
jgi:SAM-dependent methyltransferase